jgi:hypothetical protein
MLQLTFIEFFGGSPVLLMNRAAHRVDLRALKIFTFDPSRERRLLGAGDEIERQTEFLFKCVRSGLSIREPPTRGLLHLFSARGVILIGSIKGCQGSRPRTS